MDLDLSDIFNGILDEDEQCFPLMTPKTIVYGEDPMLSEFPELSIEELRDYFEADDVIRFDPFEHQQPTKDAIKNSVRRESELKRLRDHGWSREEVDRKGKRGRFEYKGPNGITVTSLKSAMKTITLDAIVERADHAALEEAEKCISE